MEIIMWEKIVKCVKCEKQKKIGETYNTVSGRICNSCYDKMLRGFNKSLNKLTDMFPDKIENKIILESDE